MQISRSDQAKWLRLLKSKAGCGADIQKKKGEFLGKVEITCYSIVQTEHTHAHKP